jgi:hypothetical protein
VTSDPAVTVSYASVVNSLVPGQQIVHLLFTGGVGALHVADTITLRNIKDLAGNPIDELRPPLPPPVNVVTL